MYPKILARSKDFAVVKVSEVPEGVQRSAGTVSEPHELLLRRDRVGYAIGPSKENNRWLCLVWLRDLAPENNEDGEYGP